MNQMKCVKCGKIIKIENKSVFERHKDEEFKCLECNPDQIGYVCIECGKTVLFNDNADHVCRSCRWKKFMSNNETRRKMSISHNERYKNLSEEDRKRISEKSRQSWTEEKRKHMSEIQKARWKNEDERSRASEKASGINNPMHGKSPYDIWIEKYGKEEADKRKEKWLGCSHNSYEGLSKEQKAERDKKTRHLGEANGMHGRSIYDVWLEKYGKEEADRRKEEMNRKKSEKQSGKNNPMYGKNAPKGSGNGISGWYKGWYFRSLRELSYMVNVIEKEGHEWRSLDNTSDFRIKYLDKDGHERSYCPDFLIDNKIVVEIKPEKLRSIELNTRKRDAALVFCLAHGYEYQITDCEVDEKLILKLYSDGIVKFTDKSKEKIEKFYKKHKIDLTNPDSSVYY